MKTTAALTLCIFSPGLLAPLKGAEVVTFEGIATSPREPVQLTNQIPGISFRGRVFAHDPAPIGNSAGLPLSAATSGTAAAFGWPGMAIAFDIPVTNASANISPSFVTVANVTAFARVDLVGYDVKLNERARTTVLVQAAARTAEEARTFKPAFVEVNSPVPLAYVAFRSGGGVLYFDDLKYSQASPEALDAPLPAPQRRAQGSFEGLLKPWETTKQLKKVIPGVSFTGSMYVQDPAQIGNSTGLVLTPATSGSAAANVYGGTMSFAMPVQRVSANVSPCFVALNGVSGFARVEMVGFDSSGEERARSAIQIRGSAATEEQIKTIVPKEIVLQSTSPLTRVDLNLDIGCIYLDDFKAK